MADAVFSAVVKRLDSIIQAEWDLLVGVTSELEKLSTTMTSIRAILQDAERKLAHDQAAKDWLHKLKDAAHCIEDILDKWTTGREISQVRRDGSHSRQQVLSNRILSCFSLSDLALRHKTARGIIQIRERLEQITAEKYKFGSGEFKEVGNEEQKATYLLNETKIFGREEDRDEIIKFLIRASGPDFATIAIVGPEGMGKTTLAGYIYNNVRVKTHFKKQMWVSLSSNIQVNRLAENIIAAADETYNRPSDPLHCLHDAMRGKRFLLILDNVWNEHIVRWDLLKATLEGGASGSRVVVTTRDQNAAVITSTDHPYTLSSLSDEACLSIFSSKAFHGRSETSELSTLKTIGKEIVKKCKGNPLAAEAVGNVMLFKRTEEEWLSVLQGEILDVPDITKADILSYDNYPSHLKPCFAYFSLFPKGHTLSRDVLIKLWMAQNFIIPRSGKEEEEIGRDYFNELLRHSLFREIKKDSDGRVIQCIMHDLPHMLAQVVAKGECCTTEIERFDSGLFQGRHLSLIVNNNNVASPTPIRFPKPGNVRTLLVFSQAGVEVELQLSHLINPLIHLRALDLSGTSIKWLPNSIENLKLLRYLNLSGSCIEEVPKSVTSLRNFQTLNLNKCQRLHKLSKGISKMVSLRHLEIEETDKLVYLPKGIGQLSSLRTLSKFTVDEMGKGCKMGELSNLNLLRGNLEMRNLGKVVRREDAESAELKNKQFLRSLLLDFESNGKEDDGTMLENGEMKKMESVLMGLRPPHANLKELKICNYMGSVLPSWMEDSPFSSLVQLNLHSCRKFKQLPALGKLPSLKILKIQGNEGVEVVGHEFYGGSNTAFPSLKELSFISLTNWEEWNLGVEDGTTKKVMPFLQELYIQDCPKLEGLLGHLPDSLWSIEIKDCKQLIWTPRRPPLHLHYLFLRGDVGILTMPLPSLPSLKNLHISDSPNQFSLHGIENLTALETLEINTCSELTSLTDRIVKLRSLQTLGIYHCRKLTTLPVGVDRLPSFTIYGCKQYTPLPDRVQLRVLQAMGGCNTLLAILIFSLFFGLLLVSLQFHRM